MIGQDLILAHLTGVFRDMEISMNGKSGSPFHEFQKNAFAALRQIDFPNRKHEDWKYTPVQKLLTPKYTLAGPGVNTAIHDIEGLDSYVIQIVNGKFTSNFTTHPLLEKGVSIYPVETAYQLPAWKEVFQQSIAPEANNPNRAFDFLNLSFSTNGWFIDIPNGLQLDKPIEFRISHEENKVSFSHPLLFIRFGRECKVSVFERFEGNDASMDIQSEGFINSLFCYHLDKGAFVEHIKWQNLPVEQSMVYKLMVTQQRDSHFSTLAFDFGGQIIRNTIDVDMVDTNTYTSLQAGFIAKGKQSMDHQTRINHLVHHCESHEQYKGILDGFATAAFNGKVYVHPDAQKTNAYQQNDTLVLSPNAVMNSKPQLEIFADDVKCSHGATIGQMDEKAIFYLKSRGIGTEQATYMLKAAFLATVLDQVPQDAIRQYVTQGMSIDI